MVFLVHAHLRQESGQGRLLSEAAASAECYKVIAHRTHGYQIPKSQRSLSREWIMSVFLYGHLPQQALPFRHSLLTHSPQGTKSSTL